MFYRTLRARDDFSKDKVDSLARQVFPGLKRYEKLDLLEIFKDYIPKGSEIRWIDF